VGLRLKCSLDGDARGFLSHSAPSLVRDGEFRVDESLVFLVNFPILRIVLDIFTNAV
jgi:hypothetical protein